MSYEGTMGVLKYQKITMDPSMNITHSLHAISDQIVAEIMCEAETFHFK